MQKTSPMRHVKADTATHCHPVSMRLASAGSSGKPSSWLALSHIWQERKEPETAAIARRMSMPKRQDMAMRIVPVEARGVTCTDFIIFCVLR